MSIPSVLERLLTLQHDRPTGIAQVARNEGVVSLGEPNQLPELQLDRRCSVPASMPARSSPGSHFLLFSFPAPSIASFFRLSFHFTEHFAGQKLLSRCSLLSSRWRRVLCIILLGSSAPSFAAALGSIVTASVEEQRSEPLLPHPSSFRSSSKPHQTSLTSCNLHGLKP